MKACIECKIDFLSSGKNHKRCVLCAKAREQVKRQEYDRMCYHRDKEDTEHISKRKNKAYLYKYGIGLLEYNKMFTDQNGCCDICKKHQSTCERSLAVDHCHTTGKVRGLLCMTCNLMLGYSKDNVDLLLTAISYLKK